jgi:hypothetical protein
MSFWDTNILTGERVDALAAIKKKPLPVVGGSLGWSGVARNMFGTGAKAIIPVSAPASSFWGSLGTTGKVLVGAGAGAGAYGIYDWFFGGKKAVPQKQELQQNLQPIQITKTYSPVTTSTLTNTYANTYQIQEGSPGAYQAFDKKDVVSTTPSIGVSPSWAIAPSQAASQSAEQKQAQGTDMIMLAAIAAVGIIGYGYFSKPKGTGK